jgi:hypothetical protein
MCSANGITDGLKCILHSYGSTIILGHLEKINRKQTIATFSSTIQNHVLKVSLSTSLFHVYIDNFLVLALSVLNHCIHQSAEIYFKLLSCVYYVDSSTTSCKASTL